MPAIRQWPEDAMIAAVQAFYATHQRWPERRDFIQHEHLPSLTVVTRRMRTWQEAVRRAVACVPQTQEGRR